MPHTSASYSPRNAREKVLSTALRLFTQQGYFNTSMRDITRESAVSTGSIYHHFSDKEGVALALYNDLVERMSAELSDIVQQHQNAHDQCRAVMSLLFDITDHEPDVMSFMLYMRHSEFLPSARPVCSSQPFEMMRSMVEHGMQKGEIRQGDVLIAASCLFGGAIRIITVKLDGLLQAPLSSFLDETWSCSWRSVARD